MIFHFPYPKSATSGGRHPTRSGAETLCVGLLACVLAGCTAEARDKDPLPAAPQPAPAAESAKAPTAASRPPAQPANERKLGEALELAGDLKPDQAADLSFKIGGQLVAVKVVRGERVNKNQVIAELSNAEARAQLAQAEAALAQADAQLALARDNEARAQSLVAANAAPGSQATAVRLQAASAEAARMQASAARDLAVATLANHQLRAPFDGEIVRVPDGVGQIVTPGKELFRLEALDKLVLRTTVSEQDVERIRVGDEVDIGVRGGRTITGKVRLVLRSLEAASRRAPIEIAVPNKDRSLIAGSYVRATLRAH